MAKILLTLFASTGFACAMSMPLASATEIKVLSTAILRSSLEVLVPQFEKSSGHSIVVGHGSAGAVTARIAKGEIFDVVAASDQQLAELQRLGRVIDGSATALGRTGIGVFIRRGSPMPDVGSIAALQRFLLSVKSIAHANPSGGGPAGIYVAKMLATLEIAPEIKTKVQVTAPGAPLFAAVARGEADVGFGQITEILHAPGVSFVAPLPSEIQSFTNISGGIVSGSSRIHEARQLLTFLTSPQAKTVMKEKGLD